MCGFGEAIVESVYSPTGVLFGVKCINKHVIKMDQCVNIDMLTDYSVYVISVIDDIIDYH